MIAERGIFYSSFIIPHSSFLPLPPLASNDLFGVFSFVMADQSESSSGLQRVATGLAALSRLW
jgi:hypothetical protein